MFPSPKHRTHLFVNRSSQRCTDKDCPHFQKLAEHPEAQWRQKRWVYVETLKCSDPKISIAKVAEADYESILAKINCILISVYEKTGTEVIEAMKEIVPGYSSKFVTLV
jgi:hypothetical protein